MNHSDFETCTLIVIGLASFLIGHELTKHGLLENRSIKYLRVALVVGLITSYILWVYEK